MSKQTFQEETVTVLSVAKFHWHRCYRVAWNHSTL